ncbi:c-type cytochrome [Ferribacterium limneticum]|uniref:c-type cytochrome n=1 Tax=Ferribacterium limneticum TaxID=76259 RepID=UPI001CFA74E0|nr:c-type cytochrome [Ferribacterium limneticum]UCV19988.1 c-type cytochrome [Ferribacterium limneticum]
MNKLLITLLTALLAASALANEVAVAPAVSPDGLPPLGDTWLSENPYRGNPLALTIGQQAYNQACARCHGADASTNAAPAPDLRNLNRFCKRISDAELNAACMRDNDAYFAKTVRHGKIIVGVTHMPPWEGVLKQELAWAIQVFFESRAGARRE